MTELPPVTRDLIERVRRARSFNRMAVLQRLPGNPYGAAFRAFGQAVAYRAAHPALRTKNRVEGLSEGDVGHLAAILAFFRDAGLRCQVPISSAHFSPALAAALAAEGLAPVFQTVQLYGAPSAFQARQPSAVAVEEVGLGEMDRYLDLYLRADGASEADWTVLRDLELAEYREPGMRFFIASLGGRAAAAGSLCIAGGIGFLVSSATLPQMRKRGCQGALLGARFAAAEAAGCDLIVSGTMLFSNSHRNMESVGLRILDVATTWMEPVPAA